MSDRQRQPPAGKKKSAAYISVDRYRDDPLYPSLVRAVGVLLARGKFVAPVEVLVAMGLLAPADLENWRLGRVPYLEMVIHCNLTRLARLLRILAFHAHALNLVPSTTVYMRWGKGPKRRLRFTKTGDSRVEAAYSRHFVWPGKGPFHPPDSGRERGGEGDGPRLQPAPSPVGQQQESTHGAEARSRSRCESREIRGMLP